MRAWLFLLIVAVGGILLGAAHLLLSVERCSRAHGQGISDEPHESTFRRRILVWFCLLPLVVYLLLWASVSASLSWVGLLVGGALLAIVAAVLICVGVRKKKGGCSDVS
ncbi:MAG: hypothetical protein ACLFV5_05165 [Anaerolineales bacterium]